VTYSFSFSFPEWYVEVLFSPEKERLCLTHYQVTSRADGGLILSWKTREE
jgi:hypothetical protein